MSKILILLQSVNDLVNDSVNEIELIYSMTNLSFKKINFMELKKYSKPKISTGGVDISAWGKLSKIEQEKALSKNWFIYYSYRNEVTGKLEQQNQIKGHANQNTTKEARMNYLNKMRDALELLLKMGFNPFNTNDFEENFISKIKNLKSKPADDNSENNIALSALKQEKLITPKQAAKKDKTQEPKNQEKTIKEAFDFALKIKSQTIALVSYKNLELRVKKFEGFFDSKKPISSITKLDVIQYLNGILEKSSPRNRNNSRADLSTIFKVLEDNEIISDNFFSKINILKTAVKKNKTYTNTQQEDIFKHLETNDPLLLLYIKFISYNFLRPVEVNRLKIKDINIKERTISFKAKNSPLKTKIIPEILFKELPDLTKYKPENYLFTPTGLGEDYQVTNDNQRRDYFSKRFKKVVKENEKFELNEDYGLYSFRHTFITKLYRELRNSYTPFEAKSNLMLITGHTSMNALEKYLRDIDAELPEDYSALFNKTSKNEAL